MPSPQALLQYYGGPVLHTNETFAIFWDPQTQLSQSYRDLVVRYLVDTAADGGKTTNVYSVLNQYSDQAGSVTYSSSFAGALVDTTPFPNGCPPSTGYPVCFQGSQLEDELNQFLHSHSVARPGNRAFMVLLPPGVNVCQFGCGPSPFFCAYHSGFSSADGVTLYAVMLYDAIPGCDPGQHPNGNAADAALDSLSHEHREMIDDPFVWQATSLGPPLAWFDPQGFESSDKCSFYYGPTRFNGVGAYNQVINGHQYLVQTEWSNALGQAQGYGCVGDGVDSSPHAAFTFTVTGQVVHVDASPSSDSDPGDAVSGYFWDFGDRSKGTGRQRSHAYAAPGTYSVRLVVVDSHGAGASAVTVVTV